MSRNPRPWQLAPGLSLLAVLVLATMTPGGVIVIIQNGMNLKGVEPHMQKVVLGLVILAAVLLDMLKRRYWSPARPGRT